MGARNKIDHYKHVVGTSTFYYEIMTKIDLIEVKTTEIDNLDD